MRLGYSMVLLWYYSHGSRAMSEADYENALRTSGLEVVRDVTIKDDLKAAAIIFKRFDANKDEHLNLKELTAWVEADGGVEGSKSSPRKQAELMMIGVDTNEDGRISIDEYTTFALGLKRREGDPSDDPTWDLKQELGEEMKRMEKAKKQRISDANKGRPIVLPEGMTEEEGRAILESRDEQYDNANDYAKPKKKAKGKKKKKAKDEV
eukprot:jgi/Chrpa1/27006/Chrysochromulina_OHIO_Genome00007398-RA